MTETTTMRAAYYEARGPARDVLRLGRLPRPEPGPGQVRVRIAVSAVNPSDVKGRGTFLGATAMQFPRIVPHQDGAGAIDAVGEGVPAARIGERVWLYMSQRGSPMGTAAEWTVLPAERAVPLPAQASFADGACLGIPAMTAHHALLADGPIAGKSVLVQGGAGAVGWYAVQLARWAGAARVIATAGRPSTKERARAAGAHVVLDRGAPDLADRIMAEAPAGIDRIVEVDFSANQALDARVLARNGVVAAYASDTGYQPVLDFRAFMVKNAVLRTLLIYEAAQHDLDAAARDINACVSAGLLIHQVDRILPLDSIVQAHQAQESDAPVGKILVDPNEAAVDGASR